MFKKVRQNNFGATLLEMMVAVALFSVTVLSAAEIFQMVVEGQRNAIAAQNTQESMRYALEVIAKEIRMAQKDVGGTGQCPNVTNGEVYDINPTNDELTFKNIYDQCVEYSLEDDANGISRLKIDRDGASDYITPDEIEVNNLQFVVIDNIGAKQSMVTLKMDVEAVGKELHKSKMKIQTTISSRYYE